MMGWDLFDLDKKEEEVAVERRSHVGDLVPCT